MTVFARFIEVLLRHGCAPRRSGSGWESKCPGHDDAKASLSIGEGQDGHVLLHCHAGCTLDQILGPLGISVSDLFADERPSTNGYEADVVRHVYHDEQGVPVLRVARRLKDGKTTQVWREYLHNGVWRTKVPPDAKPDTRHLLYNARAATESARRGEVVHVGEGERVVDALIELGFPATCNVGGASQDGQRPKWIAPHAEQLRGASGIVFWCDNDRTGEAHRDAVGSSFAPMPIPVHVVSFPDLPKHGDLVEWLDARRGKGLKRGQVKADLQALIDAAEPWKPAASVEADSGGDLREKVSQRGSGRMLFCDPEPWGEHVNGDELAKDLTKTLTSYVVLPEYAGTAVVLWAFHAHALDAAQVSPLLVPMSPVRRCGKTTLEFVLSALVPRPLMTSNISPSAIYRTIEKYRPTLLVDEADSFLKINEELRGVLNSGHHRAGAVVVRAVQGQKGDFEPHAFSTWCAKVVALIGRLPDTLEDRSIIVPMRRRTKAEPIASLRLDQLSTLEPLRRRLARWAADHMEELRVAEPSVPAELNDRARDNWRPLLAIADVLGETWPEAARAAARRLSASCGDERSAGELLLADIEALAESRGRPEVLTSEEIVSHLRELEGRPWVEWRNGQPITKNALARLLRPFGAQSRTVRLGNSTAKGYALADFREAFERYRGPEIDPDPPPPGNQTVTTSQPAPILDETAISNRNSGDGCDGCENRTPTNNDAPCDVVTVAREGGGRSGRLLDPFSRAGEWEPQPAMASGFADDKGWL